jgi:hypothetical protein
MQQDDDTCAKFVPQPPAQPDQTAAGIEPDPRFAVWGEISPDKKKDAFFTIAFTSTLGDFNFLVKDQGENLHFIPGIILRSIGGIESDWKQYEGDSTNSTTLVGDSGDYGLMQINLGNSDLFTHSRSEDSEDEDLNLCNDTLANIAAGAMRLSAWWEKGRNEDFPVVNNHNPKVIINWYYALSAYNSGPQRSSAELPYGQWLNNPNCAGEEEYCDDNPTEENPIPNYEPSRDPNAKFWDWRTLNASDYPYQERVLYNIQTPKHPHPEEVDEPWDPLFIGLHTISWLRSYGLRPADTLFVRDGISRAPDLILFETNSGYLDYKNDPPELVIGYNLPITAQITITLVGPDDEDIEVLLNGQIRYPVDGFNQERLVTSTPIQPEYGYRIFAYAEKEKGWAEGEYIRPIMSRSYLPTIQVNSIITNHSNRDLFGIGGLFHEGDLFSPNPSQRT